MKFLSLLASLVLTANVQAAVIGSCEGLDSIGNLIGNPVSFAQGAVRVAYVSTEEPAAAPDHLLVFVYGEFMSLNCYAISANDGQGGFGSIDMSKLASSYDAKKGLLISVPATNWTGEDGVYDTEIVKVRINRAGEEPVVTLE
jgi:hypothetical protein